MKTKLFLVMAALGFGLASCEKCEDCACVTNYDYEFEDGMPQEDQDFITTTYEQEFEDKTQQFCETNQDDLDALTSDWEAQSESFPEGSELNGYDWTLDFSYDCTCVEVE